MNKCTEDKNYPKPIPDKIRPVKISCLDTYDDKAKIELGSIQKINNEGEVVMECFDFYKRRNATRVGAGAYDRYKTFIHALTNSYNAEDIKIVEKTEIYPHYDEEYASLITPDEKKGQLNVSIPFQLFPQVGKLVYWGRTDSYWLITTQDETEKSYFKGTIEKCNYTLSWRDENGNIYKQRVKMQGPVETKFKNEVLRDFIGGKPNETNSIWMAKTENTKHLNRYDKLIMNGKGYQITVVNDVDNIIKINLIEGFINPEEDLIIAGEEISEGQIKHEYRIDSNLEGITELNMEPFVVKTTLYKNGRLELANPTIKVIGNATYFDGSITPTAPGKIVIKICYPDYPVEEEYIVNIIEEVATPVIYYEILGQDTIDMYGVGNYQIVKNTNGTIEVLDATMIELSSEDIVKATIVKNSISATITPKKIGGITIFVIVNGERVEKKVKIVSPW